jgi:hypothetical protein
MPSTEQSAVRRRVRAGWEALDNGWRATLLGWSIVVVVYLQQLL